MKQLNHSGFTLVELMLVLAIIMLLSIVTYGSVVDSVKNMQFQAVVSEAQTNINSCYWKKQWADAGGCVIQRSAELESWYVGFFDYVKFDGSPAVNAGDIPVFKVQMPASEEDRTFLGVTFHTSEDGAEDSATHKMVVFPRPTNLWSLMYTQQSRANKETQF